MGKTGDTSWEAVELFHRQDGHGLSVGGGKVGEET